MVARVTIWRTMAGFAAVLPIFSAMATAQQQDGLEGLPVRGVPHQAGLGFQPASSAQAFDQQWLDHYVLIIIAAVTALVCALLLWCIFRFNRRANPEPARFTHNTPLEITWTLVPVLILISIGVFSLPILFRQLYIPANPAVVIKAIGNQWYWSYEYPEENIAFDALMIDASYKIDDPAAGWGEDQEIGAPLVRSELAERKLAYFGYSPEEFLLATDNAVVVPVGQEVLMQFTATDVIHSWALPAFAMKQDAVPGRTALMSFTAEHEGVYFGQCSELCGINHSYMPIVVKAVLPERYATWLEGAKTRFAAADSPLPVQLAAR